MTLQPVARQFLRRAIPPDIPLKEYWSAGLHIYGPKPFVPSEALAYIYPEDAALIYPVPLFLKRKCD